MNVSKFRDGKFLRGERVNNRKCNRKMGLSNKLHFSALSRDCSESRLNSHWEYTNMSLSKLKPSSTPYKFYLTTVIIVRIYKNDKAMWTIKQLKQWLHYLFYAGVQHVYLCDHFVQYHERLKENLRRYVDNNLLTYIEWPWNASIKFGNIIIHQVQCYNHVICKYRSESRWQMSVDMDEYPFCENDFQRLCS